jgi:hypothetical protein
MGRIRWTESGGEIAEIRSAGASARVGSKFKSQIQDRALFEDIQSGCFTRIIE